LLFSTPALAQMREAPPRPRLVVVLVVDQMRADYVTKFRPQWKAGLRRLVEQGAWFREAAYPYANTQTCVGHATISTGSYPRTHGIAANRWWDRELGKTVTCTDDPQAEAISYGAPAPEEKHSPARLQLPTFADALREQTAARARVVTFSLKARSAIMLAGHGATSVVWHDDKSGAWVTSSAYGKTPVAFVQDYVKAHPVESDFGKSWVRAMPEADYFFVDDGLGERPSAGWTSTFPHVLQGKSDKPDADFYALWERSPFADAYLARLAEAAVDRLGLGKGRSTDYLAISFSTLDLVGHAFGPNSHEVQDVLVRLDATLGEFFQHLDRAVGRNHYVVVLSADHGVVPIPEQTSAMKLDAGRLKTADVVNGVNKTLAPLIGVEKPVATMLDSDLYFAPGVSEKLAKNPEALRATIDAILSFPGVARVFWSQELRDANAATDHIQRAAALSYVPGRSGDLFVVQKPYWLWGAAVPGLATNHGTSYDYDARVPLLLMGDAIRRGEYSQAASPADIAPTLGFLCGIRLAHSEGRVLTEALTVAGAVPKAAPRATASPSR